MIQQIKNNRETVFAILMTAFILAALLMLPGLRRRGQRGYATLMALTGTSEAAETSLWNQSVLKVKEDRGEPMGRQAKVDVPAELLHYSDSRRFLAIQVAEWREHHFDTPQDFVGLARQIEKGELVELKRASDTYVLFGVGGIADQEPFTHYDQSTGKRIALYGETEIAQEYKRIAESGTELENEIAGLRQELKAAAKGARSKRVKLQAEISGMEKRLKAGQEKKELLDAYYDNAESRGQLLSDYQVLSNLAANFSGYTYKMSDPASRQAMKIRMLSFLRPEALKVLEEIAASYHQQFDRPLPVTSLVRPDEYQHMLSKVNPNATLIETPPHSTGLAFDINYRYMTAEEQTYVMSYLARLEDEGRIEVLRENRDHYHVFAFIDGRRPGEEFILASLGRNAPAKAANESVPKEQAARKEEKKVERKAAHKETKKVNKEVRKTNKSRSKRR
ncbi:MAG TPA: DUF5715 family protein [Pyrinomonadaceae bacterium]|jgi:hypothetical protein